MNPFRQKVEELVDLAKSLHDRERGDTLESIDFIGELIRRNASGYLGLDTRGLAKRIGLTHDQFLKRAQAARVMHRFPEFRELLASGRTTLSNLRLISPRLTEANRAYFLERIQGKSARQVAQIVAGIDPCGRSLISKEERQVEVLLERAQEIVRSRGRRFSRHSILKEALEYWLSEWDDADPKSDANQCLS